MRDGRGGQQQYSPQSEIFFLNFFAVYLVELIDVSDQGIDVLCACNCLALLLLFSECTICTLHLSSACHLQKLISANIYLDGNATCKVRLVLMDTRYPCMPMHLEPFIW